MSAIKGDFIGFTIDGIHSVDLGIDRISNGSRYTQALLSDFSNSTKNVVGANRTDYFGVEYKSKEFSLEIAFDTVTEKQLRQMQKLFGTTKPVSLVFEETPYKTYYVKANNAPSLTWLCFDIDGERVYKGEGVISFISFFPYGFCDPNYAANNNPENKNEWLAASGLKEQPLAANEVYNCGDFDTPFMVTGLTTSGSIVLGDSKLEWSGITLENSDTKVRFNGHNQLIEGIDSNGKPTSNVYNKYITGGNWFSIPKDLDITTIEITGFSGTPELKYDILYY